MSEHKGYCATLHPWRGEHTACDCHAADRTDTERLDWLEKQRNVIGGAMGAPTVSAWSITGRKQSTLRDAIDAAMDAAP